MFKKEKYNSELDLKSRNSLSLIINRIKPGSTILEFGPAYGRMTKYLKETLNCKVYAVEIYQPAAERCQEYAEKIIVGDIEKYKWLQQFKNIKFDYIVLADVLEHLRDPERVMLESEKLLAKSGSILFSIPNIAHTAIVRDLIDGKFEYTDEGLLDRTHIHFFTKKSIDQMLKKSELYSVYETGTYVEAPNTEFQTSIDSVLETLTNTMLLGNIYQFIYEAKKDIPTNRQKFQIEKDFLNFEYFTLYYDSGNDFNEKEKLIGVCEFDDKNILSATFTIPKEIETFRVRFDPGEEPVRLKIENIKVNGARIDQSYGLKTNGDKQESDEYLFFNTDPQIHINNATPIKTITFKLTFFQRLSINYYNEKLNQLNFKNGQSLAMIANLNDKNSTLSAKLADINRDVANLTRNLKKKDQENSELNTRNTALSATIAELNNKIDKLQDTIDNKNQQIFAARKKEFAKKPQNLIKQVLGIYIEPQFCNLELPCNYFPDYWDEEAYLDTNEDVKQAVKDALCLSGFDHFCHSGFDEVKNGQRVIHKNLFKYNEEKYAITRPDVTKAIEDGSFPYSLFAHYLMFAYKEHSALQRKQNIKRILKKVRRVVKHPHLIINLLQDVKKYGIKGVLSNLKKLPTPNTYHFIEPELTSEISQAIKSFKYKPLISIIMPVYNVDPKWLDLAIRSIQNQWYQNWELCIADDASKNRKTIKYLKSINNKQIKIHFSKKNQNISLASNEALKLAKGEYIALMDNDDEITPNALYEAVKTINETGAEFIYSDEDKIEMDGSFSDPHFKPDFSPDMFLAQNYLSHLGVIKRYLVEKVNGWTHGMEGAQDYDLYLKVLEHTNKIHHIAKVLYHWRKIPGSTADDFYDKSYAQEAGKQALTNAIKRRNINAEVFNGPVGGTYRIKYEIKSTPLVSIIIPFKDHAEVLKTCITSILKKSTYQNFEIIGISNNSTNPVTFTVMDELKAIDDRISFHEYNIPFNFSKINNYAVKKYTRGDYILLLNNDMEVISSEWIEEMLMLAQKKDVAAVGAKLYYANDTIQHAGVIVGIDGVAGHSHKYLNRSNYGYFSRLQITQNLSAVTAACLMIKKSIYIEIGGLDEKNLTIAFNDVDFCLRLRENGYLNVFTPYSELYHHESISRGQEDDPIKQARFKSEIDYMQERHKDFLFNKDPYYNKNLTLDREDFSLR